MQATLSNHVLILLLGIIISACSPASETVHETRFMMGTLVDFTVYGDNTKNTSIAIKAAADEMQRIENLFTIYGDQNNSVKIFNSAKAGSDIKLSDEVDALLIRSIQIEQKSGGAFNPALGSLNMLWGFSQSTSPTSPPPAEEIKQLLTSSSHCLQQHADGWSRTGSSCQLDFGAIAKGYALEQGMKQLKLHGIKHAIINAGGDIRISGSHGERPWQIGIRHPRQPGQVIATLKIDGDKSVVTSGDYERFYLFQGKRYHHILDPLRGMPASRSQSATVIADNATSADAWSTALFVMGKKGVDTIEKLGMDAILVDANGKIHTTKNIESRLQLSLSPPMLRTSD